MFVKIPLDVLERMPIRDRKYYIHKYNEYMTAKENAMNHSSSSTDIGAYTNMSQGVTGDAVFE